MFVALNPQALILTQCAAWFGRSGVTFVLSWLAAAGAHRFTHPSAVRGWRHCEVKAGQLEFGCPETQKYRSSYS